MSVDIPSDLVPFVHAVIASGRCHSESEVVGEALRLLETVERKRDQLRTEVLDGINSGESISRGDVVRQVKDWAAHQATAKAEKPV